MNQLFNQNHQILKFSYRRLIILIIIALGIYLLIPKLLGVKESLKLLCQANLIFIFLGIGGILISYSGAAWLLKLVTKDLKYKFTFFDLIRISTVGAFAVHFFPISGAGEAMIGYHLFKSRHVSPGDILFIYIIRSIFFYIAFFTIFALGLLIIPSHPLLTSSQKVVSIIIFIIIVAITFWIRYLLKDKKRFSEAGFKFLGIINFLSKKILRKKAINQSTCEIIVNDIYDGFQLYTKQRKREWLPALFRSGIYWLGDIFILFCSLLAFGYLIHPGTLIFSYCLATLIGLLSFIPGGLGVMEGTLGLSLISFGVPADIAVFGIIIYRLISFWLLMPVGFVSFLTLQRENNSHENK